MFTKYEIHQNFEGDSWIFHSRYIDLDKAMSEYLALKAHYENGTGPTLKPRLVQIDYTVKTL